MNLSLISGTAIAFFKTPVRIGASTKKIMRIGLVGAVVFVATSIQFLMATPLKGQSIEDVYVKIELRNESLIDAFKKIESKTSFHFMYRSEDVQNIRNLNLAYSERTVSSILKMLLSNTSLRFKQMNTQILIQPSTGAGRVSNDGSTNENNDGVFQKQITGRVTNADDEPLVGVSITVKGTSVGTSTDEKGAFRIAASASDVLVFSNVGFAPQEITVGSKSTIAVNY